jgi:hypothetical protein
LGIGWQAEIRGSMVTQSKAWVDAIESMLEDVNEGCDRATETCSRLDHVPKGSLAYEDELEELTMQIEALAAKLEYVCDALESAEKSLPKPPPPARPM